MIRKLELFSIVVTAGLFLLAALLVVYRLQKGFKALPTEVTTLKSSEQARVVIRSHRVDVVSRSTDGSTHVVTQYVPTRAVVTVNKDGSLDIVNKRFGLTLEPQFGATFSDSFRLALAAKLVYFDRWGLNVGLAVAPRSSLSPIGFIALSYTAFSNTSVFVGVDNHKEVVGGVLVRF